MADRILLAANRAVCAALLAVAAGLVFANVVGRYLFGTSFAWAEEASRYLMIWCAFLGAGLALREGAHLAVDALVDALPAAPRRALRAATVAIVALFCVALAWLGWGYAEFAAMQRTPVLRLSATLVYLAAPVGAVLMLLHLAATARGYVLREPTDADRVHAAEMGNL